MRALIAERMVLEPASAAVPRTYCQFGPLHTSLMRPFVALDRFAPRSTRYLSFLAGIAVFFPFLAFARRLVGQAHAELAAFMLAVSPLHLQASTTAASEALYLLLWVGALERLLSALESGRLRTFAVSGLLASLAAVTRYDAWLALPLMVVAAWWLSPGRRKAVAPGLVTFSLAAALLPVAWLAWGALAGGDPLFFAHYIEADHAGLAATAVARYGVVLGRLRQLGVWSLAFVAAMTPPGSGAGRGGVRAWLARAVDADAALRGGGPRAPRDLPRPRARPAELRAAGAVRAGPRSSAASAGGERRPAGARPRVSRRVLRGGGAVLDRGVARRHRGSRAHLGRRRIDGGAHPPRRRGSRGRRVPACPPPARRARDDRAARVRRDRHRPRGEASPGPNPSPSSSRANRRRPCARPCGRPALAS